MQFPYGLSEFDALIQEGYFYQDRTDRIPQIEDAGRQRIFIRPRRFGKSLLLSMLEQRFSVADVLIAVKDQPFMASLLDYFGVLTLTGQTDFIESILNIPNRVARSLYVEQLQVMWLDT